jgi:hypothetical protein
VPLRHPEPHIKSGEASRRNEKMKPLVISRFYFAQRFFTCPSILRLRSGHSGRSGSNSKIYEQKKFP